MKERFDKRLMKGKIKVTCKKKKVIVAVWEARKEDIVNAIMSITERQMQAGYSISLRGLFYKLVSQNLMINYLEVYKRLILIVRDCRYAGLLDWNAISIDGPREVKLQYYVKGIPDALQDTIDQYKLDRQSGQMNYIEVWVEKDTLADILLMTTNKYHIPLCIVKGRDSSTAIYQGYQRFKKQLSHGRRVKLIYIGDHDPSGKDMIRDIKDRVLFMLNNSIYSQDYKSSGFEVLPIALTLDQIREYNLPANKIKESDKITPWYVKTFRTKECWEVDALDSEVLSDILEKTILDLIDIDLYNEVLEQEAKDIEALKKLLK